MVGEGCISHSAARGTMWKMTNELPLIWDLSIKSLDERGIINTEACIYLYVKICYMLSYACPHTETLNQILSKYLKIDFHAVFDTFPLNHVITYSYKIKTDLTLVSVFPAFSSLVHHVS